MYSNQRIKKEVVLPELSYKVNGILFEVHNKLGRFKQEKHYSSFLEKVLKENNIIFEREKTIKFPEDLPFKNRIDFIIENKLVLELKSKRFITTNDYLQTKKYLEILNLPLALIVNFRQKYLKPRRILNSKSHS